MNLFKARLLPHSFEPGATWPDFWYPPDHSRWELRRTKPWTWRDALALVKDRSN